MSQSARHPTQSTSRKRQITGCLLTFLLTLSWTESHAAYNAAITNVLDAADGENRFDLRLDVGYRRTATYARITRENVVEGKKVFADELTYNQVVQQLDMSLALGLYRDLELQFSLPYTFQKTSRYTYSNGVSEENSTVTRDPFVGGPLFAVPYQTYQRGIDRLDISIAYNPFNDQRDDTKPTWLLRLTYGAPIGPAFKPQSGNADEVASLNGLNAQNPAPIGEKAHRLTFETALSKRFASIEPYGGFNYTIPFAAAGSATGFQPSQTFTALLGAEFIPWEAGRLKERRVSFDIRLFSNYITAGRIYSELTNPLLKLTAADQHAALGGHLAILIQPIRYLRINAGISVNYATPHTLTNESVGSDKNQDGVVNLSDPKERNTLYNSAYDSVGHRFRAEDTVTYSIYAGLALTL